MYKVSKYIEKNFYNIDKPKFYIPAERKGKENNIHVGLLNIGYNTSVDNPFEYKDLYTRFLVIDDLFLSFIMHTVAMHANRNYFQGRHIMMREIIPKEIFTDEFVGRMQDVLQKCYDDHGQEHPEWFNKLDELKEFIRDVRDKYLFEWVSIHDSNSELCLPEPLRYTQAILFKPEGYKSFYQPTNRAHMEEMIKVSNQYIFWFVYDVALRNLILACYKAYNEKNGPFQVSFNKIKAKKEKKEPLTDEYLRGLIEFLYREVGSHVENTVRMSRSLDAIVYDDLFNRYLEHINKDYHSFYDSETKYCHVLRLLNEIDIDFYSVLEIDESIFNLMVRYFKDSKKFKMFPKSFDTKWKWTNAVIWNRNRLSCEEKKTHCHEGFPDNYSLIFRRTDKDDEKLSLNKNYNIRFDLVQLTRGVEEKRKAQVLWETVHYKMEKSHRMYIFNGEFNQNLTEASDLYRVFDTTFKDRYTLFRKDLEEVKEQDFFYTCSYEKSCLGTDVNEYDHKNREVSHVLHSNWQTRYFASIRVPCCRNKFMFVSLQGKSHDKDVKPKKDNTGQNKTTKEKEELEKVINEHL